MMPLLNILFCKIYFGNFFIWASNFLVCVFVHGPDFQVFNGSTDTCFFADTLHTDAAFQIGYYGASLHGGDTWSGFYSIWFFCMDHRETLWTSEDSNGNDDVQIQVDV